MIPFNDRTQFVYLLDTTLDTRYAFYSLYYEIATGKIWEGEFHWEWNGVHFEDVTRLIFPNYYIGYYDQKALFSALARIKDDSKT